ncbi:MAG: hypothetical protein H0T42_17745 [Deltaproteobacteria bacterium]|nr:hypothetical protein [Deltaproteobacteria bacterium]
MRYGLLTLALLTFASCGPTGRDRVTPDATDLPLRDSSPPQCYDQAIDAEVELAIQIEQSCAIWNSLAELDGRARVSRAGTIITIDFGNGVVFSGPLTMGVVDMTYTHPHTFTDGCGWEARETLAGQLDPTSCKFNLRYDYVESVVTNTGGCATPCSAQADVTLELTPIIL